MIAVVDLGSNGIRCSITRKDSGRCLTQVYGHRIGISLYDAQFETATSMIKGNIPSHVIDKVVEELRRFKTICSDYCVAEQDFHLVATEGVRYSIKR